MSLLTVLLPQRCPMCGRPGVAICSPCRADLVRITPPLCERCGAPGPWPTRRCAECSGRRLAFASARAALVYEERARALVGAWKEHGRRDLVSVAADLIVEIVPRPTVDALCPVPGDRDRGLRRGHSSAGSLTRELAVRWELPAVELLRRRPGIERQQRLSRASRRRNVARAFAPVGVAPRRMCLVDDVYTTGSTATACATELRRIGANRVDVVCFARAVR